jgi:hypothetical protein
MVTRHDHAQRLLWIEGKQNRAQRSFSGRLTWAAGLRRSPMDVIELELPELWAGPWPFRIVRWKDLGLDGVDIVAAEYDGAVWDDEPYIDPGAQPSTSWLLAVDDSTSLAGDESVTLDLVANDLPDPDLITIAEIGDSDDVTISLQEENRNVVLTRKEGFVGSLSFSYTATDGVSYSTATVNVTVSDDDDDDDDDDDVIPLPSWATSGWAAGDPGRAAHDDR